MVHEGINDIPTTAPWMVKYFQGGYDEAKKYTRCSNKKVYPICPNCGRIKDKRVPIQCIYNNNGIGCVCGDGFSYPFKIMYNILEQLNINFQTEYSPDWIGRKFYDFYIPILNCIIEIHGEQHYKDTRLLRRTLKEEQENDKYKKTTALNNGIKDYIEIDCRESDLEWIKLNILKSELSSILDVSNVDWKKASEFANNSLVKTICCFWNDNHDNMTNIEIAEHFKVHPTTVKRYLRKGTEIGMCDYKHISCKDSIKKAIESASKSNSKKVEVFYMKMVQV